MASDPGPVTRIVIVALSTVLAFALGTAPAAALVTRTGNPLAIPAGEKVSDTLFASGDSVTLGATFEGDVFVSGGTVAFTGEAKRNLFVFAGRIRIDGIVDGDLLAMGGTVDLGPGSRVRGNVYTSGGQVRSLGRIDGEIFGAGGQIELGDGANVGKSAALAGGTMNLAGPVGKDLLASGGTLGLSSSVGGSVRAEVDTLEIADTARIAGDLTYISRREASVPSGVVSGQVLRVAPQDTNSQVSPVAAILGGLFAWLQTIVGMLVFGLLLVLAAPGTMTMSERRVQRDPWKSLGIGVAAMIVIPAVAGILLVAGVFLGGWWIALFALVALLIALVVGYVVTAMCMARWLLERFTDHRNHPLLTMALGVVLLGFVAAVPFVGWAIGMGAGAAGLGALLTQAYGRRTHLPDADRLAEEALGGPKAARSQPSEEPSTAA
jgi:cytoskeletal protein CcmA (bactofilin family)